MTSIVYQLRACIKESEYGLTHLATAHLPDGGEREVLIKILQPRLTQDPVLLSHLAGYLDVARGLLRPGIAPIWDFGQAGEYCFLVREYLPGVSLDQLFQLASQGRVVLSPAMAVYIAREIASAIAAIHRYRVPGEQPIYLFHGGLSPHNVLLTRIGDTVVTDAGMDVILWRDDHSVNTLRQRKAAYHPPEYLAGQRPMRRGDTYSVAALLYQMVVGLSPKDAIQQAGHGSFVLPSHQNPRVTAAFDDLLFAALHPSSDKRMMQIERFLQVLSQPTLLRQAPVSLREAMEYIEVLVREESTAISQKMAPPFFDIPFQLQTLLPIRSELPPPQERYRPPQFEDTGPFHPVGDPSPKKASGRSPFPESASSPPSVAQNNHDREAELRTISRSRDPRSLPPAALPLPEPSLPEQTAAVPFAAIFGISPSSDHLEEVKEEAGTSETVAALSPLSPEPKGLLGSTPRVAKGRSADSQPPQKPERSEAVSTPLAFQETSLAPYPTPPPSNASIVSGAASVAPVISSAPRRTPASPLSSGGEIPASRTQPVPIPSFASEPSDEEEALDVLQPVEEEEEDPPREPTVSLSLDDVHEDESSLRLLLEQRVHAKSLADQKHQKNAPAVRALSPPPTPVAPLSSEDTPESLEEIPEGIDELPEEPESDEDTPPHGLPSLGGEVLPTTEEDDEIPDPSTIADLTPLSSVLNAVPPAAPIPQGSGGAYPVATQPVPQTAGAGGAFLPASAAVSATSPAQPSPPPSSAASPSASPATEGNEEEAEERFGKFVLLNRVALGGMAEVFRAKVEGHEGFQRLVAVKRILPEYSQDATFIEMFKDEARIAGSLLHPHIVQIFELGEVEGTYFISMEFIDGIDLARVIKIRRALNQAIPLEIILSIGIAVCRALQYAHEERDLKGQPLQMIHRDVTPHNVLLSRKGEIKLTDFGIAKAAQNVTQTAVGELKGKLSYMSPEQAAGRILDRRSDLFQVGILLYELLTLRKMFEGNSDQTLLLKIQNGDYAPIRALLPELHPGFEAILSKALAGAPEDRFQAASDLEQALLYFRDHLLAPPDRSEVVPFVHEILFQRDELLSQYAASRRQQKQTFSLLEDPNAVIPPPSTMAPTPVSMPTPPSPHFQASAGSPPVPPAGGPYPGSLYPSYPPAFTGSSPGMNPPPELMPSSVDPLAWATESPPPKKPPPKRAVFVFLLAAFLLLGIGVSLLFVLGGEPEARDSLLTINSNPPGAVVRLDGLEIGTTPIFEKKIAYDKDPHLIQIHKEGYLIFSTEIRLKPPGEETTLSAILRRTLPRSLPRPPLRFTPAPRQPTPIPLPPSRYDKR